MAARTAGAQLRRLLALLPYLLAHPGARTADVAALFGVTEAQLRADLEVLWFCGLPGLMPGDYIEVDMEAVDGEGVIRVANADYLSRPLRLGVDEAVSLLVALRALAETVDADQRPVVSRLIARLEEAAGQASRVAGRVSVQLPAPAQTRQAEAAVRAGLRDGKALHLRYWVPSRDETTERDVDPLRWVEADGAGYLEAWCRSARDIRLFRVDRMAAVQVLDEPSSPPPEATVRDRSGGLFDASDSDLLVRLELEREAAWVAEYYQVESIQQLRGGRLAVTMRVGDPRWVERLVLRLGGAATVVRPAEIGVSARAAARRALAHYA
jgi:proteasome accessory factor C